MRLFLLLHVLIQAVSVRQTPLPLLDIWKPTVEVRRIPRLLLEYQLQNPDGDFDCFLLQRNISCWIQTDTLIAFAILNYSALPAAEVGGWEREKRGVHEAAEGCRAHHIKLTQQHAQPQRSCHLQGHDATI
eukprot:1140892-Pelagomonas_calceolata.AAC.3